MLAAAFAYGTKLETDGEEEISVQTVQTEAAEKKEPVQIVKNFIEKDADLAVYYFDVGQGDSSLIVYGDKTVLIDAGESNMGETVCEDIKALGIDSLDYVIASHPHSDHIGGMKKVIETFDIGTVIAPKVSDEMTPTTSVYEKFLKALNAKGLRLTAAKVGTVYSLTDKDIKSSEKSDTYFEIIAPVGDDYENLNNWSVGIRLVHGETSFIFAGDAETEAEYDMLSSGETLSADVYKTSHHGSSSSSSSNFLKEVDPSVAIISCGADNSYGHPHKETIESFDEMGIKYYRTDQYGTVTVYSDGEAIKIVTEKET
jgi:beta-lactamase superfamily II metal-dependent hydrolase